MHAAVVWIDRIAIIALHEKVLAIHGGRAGIRPFTRWLLHMHSASRAIICS